MTPLLDGEALKEVINCVGYAFMGLVGLFGAWKRMRTVTARGPSQLVQEERGSTKTMPIQRLEKVEHDISALRNRQTEIHRETILQQNAMLTQQSAMFDLLVQQRSLLDKILGKMGGLS